LQNFSINDYLLLTSENKSSDKDKNLSNYETFGGNDETSGGNDETSGGNKDEMLDNLDKLNKNKEEYSKELDSCNRKNKITEEALEVLKENDANPDKIK